MCPKLALKKSSYPNVIRALQLLLLLPVTSASVERSNSALGFVKTSRRSTMKEDRLNSLLMVFCHKDLAEKLDLDKVVQRFASAHPRRILLSNPFAEWTRSPRDSLHQEVVFSLLYCCASDPYCCLWLSLRPGFYILPICDQRCSSKGKLGYNQKPYSKTLSAYIMPRHKQRN